MDIIHLTGSDIRDLRDQLGWTREKLSEVSGVPHRTINDIETGRSKNPGIETIKKILKAMPNYTPVSDDRNQLILDIQHLISNLDVNDLSAIKVSILKRMV